MAGFRDVLIHNYFGVDLDIVWDAMKNQIPKIYPMVKEIVENEIGKSGQQERLEY